MNFVTNCLFGEMLVKENDSTVFKGRIVTVRTRKHILPNEHVLEMEVVEHPGGAAVVALNENGEICLLKQYRAVFDDWFWELPAGKRDDDEPPVLTARRELREEAGVIADQWQELGSMVSSPGVFTERVYLFLAQDLILDQAEPAEDEVIGELQWIPLSQALQWAHDCEISDAKSVIAIARAAHVLQI